MSGRAGRAGQDVVGDSILIHQESNIKEIDKIVNGSPVVLTSILAISDRALDKFLIDILGTKVVKTKQEIIEFIGFSLLASELPANILERAQNSLGYLLKNDFIIEESTDLYSITQLTEATLASSMFPDDALLIYSVKKKKKKHV